MFSHSLSLTMLRTERSCGNPGTPDNGEKNSSSYQYGNAISFTCNVGYTMQGSPVRTCQTNGEWTGTQPTCPSKLDSFYVILIVRQGRQFTESFPLRQVFLRRRDRKNPIIRPELTLVEFGGSFS